MIEYRPGRWGIAFILQITGSVVPKAFVWSVPATVAAGFLNLLYRSDGIQYTGWIDNLDGVLTLWSSYTTVLGFLIVFRNNQAYSRFWEGAERIHQVRGKWFNAASSLVAFCNCDSDKAQDVRCFQHCMIRLVSMLHCAALQQVADLVDDRFEILNPDGVDRDRLVFLSTQPPSAQCEILIQWLQRLVFDASDTGTLKVPPPILSRVYHELAGGLVDLHSVTKIKEVPFPFPYAQMLTLMLLVHLLMTTLFAAKVIESFFWSCFMNFVITTCFWALYYISLEIEQPFGEDPNDLPIKDLQKDLNQSLRMLLMPQVQKAPPFKLSDAKFGLGKDGGCNGHLGDAENDWLIGVVDASSAFSLDAPQASGSMKSLVAAANGFTDMLTAFAPLKPRTRPAEELRAALSPRGELPGTRNGEGLCQATVGRAASPRGAKPVAPTGFSPAAERAPNPRAAKSVAPVAVAGRDVDGCREDDRFDEVGTVAFDGVGDALSAAVAAASAKRKEPWPASAEQRKERSRSSDILPPPPPSGEGRLRLPPAQDSPPPSPVQDRADSPEEFEDDAASKV